MVKHPNIPIQSDTTIQRAMRKAKEEQEAEILKESEKALDEPPVDKMQRAPVVKK